LVDKVFLDIFEIGFVIEILAAFLKHLLTNFLDQELELHKISSFLKISAL
jgi:hypothetical protein